MNRERHSLWISGARVGPIWGTDHEGSGARKWTRDDLDGHPRLSLGVLLF